MAIAPQKVPYDPADHQYPKMKYLGNVTHVVHSEAEEKDLGAEWFNTLDEAKKANPEAFAPAAVAVAAPGVPAGASQVPAQIKELQDAFDRLAARVAALEGTGNGQSSKPASGASVAPTGSKK